MEETTIGEGNVPVQNVKTEELLVGGYNTKVSYHENGDVTVEEPENLTYSEIESWQSKAKNEIKALKKANDNYSEAKRLKSDVDERERKLAEKQREIEAKLAELESKLGNSKSNDNDELYGYDSVESLEQAWIDNPVQVAKKMEKSIEKRLSQSYEAKFNNVSSEMSLKTAIEREGYSFQSVEQFAKSLGAKVNLQTFNTFKKISGKAPAKSAFDNISDIQESSIKFVKGSRGDRETKDNYNNNPYSRGTKSLNDI